MSGAKGISGCEREFSARSEFLARSPTSLPIEDWSARSGQTIPSLDGVRACSVSIVLVGHLILPSSLIGFSALGLDIFYLVSGFLITRLFFAEAKDTGSLNLRTFYLRRIIRLYPVLLVYLMLVLTIQVARGASINRLEVSSVLFYFWNYLVAHNEFIGIWSNIPIGQLWSLSVEEHFYLFAPIAFVFVRGSASNTIKIALSICIGSLLLRYLYISMWPGIEKTLWIYRHSETRGDSIAYGMLLACLAQSEAHRHIIRLLAGRRAFVISAVALFCTYAIRDEYFRNTLLFSLRSLTLIPLLCGVVFGEPFPIVNSLLNQPIVKWVGQISYSLYVWQFAAIFFFSWCLFRLPLPLDLALQLVLTFVFACCSFYLIERPSMQLRKFVTVASRAVADSPQSSLTRTRADIFAALPGA
jgi:peptidoglycan/LPS O-acetylase OafA/YrhL